MGGYRKFFVNSISRLYADNAETLLATTDNHFIAISVDTAFAQRSANPVDHRLGFSAYFLAFIKTLDEQGVSFENIRTICLEIVTAYVMPKNLLQQYLKRLPAKLVGTWLAKPLLRKFSQRVNHKAHPDGFVAKIITDKNETFGLGYGIDIIECGICKLFAKHHFEKYASILCEVDEVTSGLAGLQLIRNGTIARGAHVCDFRFKKL